MEIAQDTTTMVYIAGIIEEVVSSRAGRGIVPTEYVGVYQTPSVRPT